MMAGLLPLIGFKGREKSVGVMMTPSLCNVAKLEELVSVLMTPNVNDPPFHFFPFSFL
jgi:hypothetical protein